MVRFDSFIFEQDYPEENENIIDLMMELIISLEPEQLDDEQYDMVIKILDEIDSWDYDVEENVIEGALAKKSTPEERRYFKNYYRSHKKRIRDKINRFNNSGKGKLRQEKIKRLKKTNLTPSGRSKVSHRT